MYRGIIKIVLDSIRFDITHYYYYIFLSYMYFSSLRTVFAFLNRSIILHSPHTFDSMFVFNSYFDRECFRTPEASPTFLMQYLTRIISATISARVFR